MTEERIESGSETPSEQPASRRGVLGGLSVAIASTVAYVAGSKSAQASHGVGEVGTSSNPVDTVYADTLVLQDHGTDPSSPEDGEIWYNSSA